MKKIALVISALILAPSVYAATDAACMPIIKASEARAAASAWASSTTVSPEFKMQAMKINGQSYTQVGDGGWKKSPIDHSENERQMLAQITSGQIKLSRCKDSGSDVIDGVATRVVAYVMEMPGAPATAAKLFIGKADGLPYAQSSDKTQSRYRYTGLSAPKL
nr:hypothetical protein [uncultured Rhodoferax sp.]